MSCMCLSVVTMGYSRDLLDVCFGDQLAGSAHEPMHRGWHTFLSWLSGRNFGALFEVICVGWIDESEIVRCISYNHTPRILEVTLEYLGDIRVLVDMCLKVLFYYELYDRSNGKNSFVLFYYRLLNRLIRKDNFEVVSYPTIISSFVLRY